MAAEQLLSTAGASERARAVITWTSSKECRRSGVIYVVYLLYEQSVCFVVWNIFGRRCFGPILRAAIIKSDTIRANRVFLRRTHMQFLGFNCLNATHWIECEQFFSGSWCISFASAIKLYIHARKGGEKNTKTGAQFPTFWQKALFGCRREAAAMAFRLEDG